MFDVHPPRESIHGWRDFSVHLATITIGLLIALGLESCVEWLHHRHIMHQAQKSMLEEIKGNAASVQAKLEALQKHQLELKQDIEVLKRIINNPGAPSHDTLSLRFDINGFENLSWVTAQSTGAVGYMPYAVVREYSDIYGEQGEIDAQTHQAIRDLTVALGPLLNKKSDDPPLNLDEAKSMKQHIETLQGQLYMVDSLLHSMDKIYSTFLQTH